MQERIIEIIVYLLAEFQHKQIDDGVMTEGLTDNSNFETGPV